MIITGKLKIVKAKKPTGLGYEAKLSGLKVYVDNPFFMKAGVDAHDFLMNLQEPDGKGGVNLGTDPSQVTDRQKVLLSEGTQDSAEMRAEYTSSGTLDVKMIVEAGKPSKEQLNAQAEALVRQHRTPDDQPADTKPVDRNSSEFKDALKVVTASSKPNSKPDANEKAVAKLKDKLQGRAK